MSGQTRCFCGQPAIHPGVRGYVHFIRHSGQHWRKTVRPSARLRQAIADAAFWEWCADTPTVPR